MASLMVDSTTRMLDKWASIIRSGQREIDVEKEIIGTAAEIIAKTSFGICSENGEKVFEKLRAMQVTLFKSNRFVGVPFSKFICPKQTLFAKSLGKEIDSLLLSIITSRKKPKVDVAPEKDLLGLLLKENRVDGRIGKTLTTRELVDECKTFFFGGHETTALSITWTLLVLALHPEWQNQLREEITEVIGDGDIDVAMLPRLKKV